ncbi:MAG TPA: DUF4388 domain-containing protein, partial [Planctomycetota bacterium]|nr:DUF4388 domain-containing protein [Planctomycetota bacterium]
IIFEAVDGRTLSQEIAKRGRLAPARAVGIGIELCAALEHAHSLGVVHRNITPSAVVVQKDGHVKLVDFGFAKSLAGAKGGPALTRQGQALGAVEYAPPEQVRDASAVDHRADIYAVGSTLYHALAGEPPLIKINPERLDDPSADVPATLTEVAPELPESVRRLVERAMKPDPAKRFQSAAELRAALEAVEAELEAGSTSGAFRAIEATARIVVGGSTAGSTGSGFLGRVQTDEMIELLQMVEHNRKSGTLEIHGSPDARGRRLSGNVAFREGRIVSASSSEHRPGEPRATAEHEGADAIYELLLLPSGNFRVIYGDVPAQAGEASIVISAMLMELMRRRDETKRAPLQ